MKADKEKNGKPQIHLIPAEVLLDIAERFSRNQGEGKKYPPMNSRKPQSINDLYDAAQRHLLKFMSTEHSDLDEDDDNHVLCAINNLIMLLDSIKRGDAVDDRFQVDQVVPNREPVYVEYNVETGSSLTPCPKCGGKLQLRFWEDNEMHWTCTDCHHRLGP